MRRLDQMPSQEPARKGWLLYVSFAIVLGLLWLERHASLTQTDHTAALIAIVVAFFVVTLVWLSREGGI